MLGLWVLTGAAVGGGAWALLSTELLCHFPAYFQEFLERGETDVPFQEGLVATLTALPTGTHSVVTGTCPHIPCLWPFPSLHMALAHGLPCLSRS